MYKIVSSRTVNAQHGQLVILLGMWYADERVAAKPYGDGERAVICTINRVENEEDWCCSADSL